MDLTYAFGDQVSRRGIALQIMTSGANDFPLNVTSDLSISFQAEVERGPSRDLSIAERIHIRNLKSDRTVTVPRQGKLFVSCSPSGERVPVDSINIGFRELRDTYTDRGIVWVIPGVSPKMLLTFKQRIRKLDIDQTERILEAAETAVRERLISLLDSEVVPLGA